MMALSSQKPSNARRLIAASARTAGLTRRLLVRADDAVRAERDDGSQDARFEELIDRLEAIADELEAALDS